MTASPDFEAYAREDADALVEILFQESQRPAKDRENVRPHVERLASAAQTDGLSDASIGTLLKTVLGRDRFDGATCNAIIANLFPATPVSSAVVCYLVSRLGPGAGRAPLPVQNGALRWLVLVSDVLADQSVMGKLYGVLFNLLDLTPLRGYVCQLLYAFTEPHHVKPYRASALNELRKTPNSSEHVVALLTCYRAVRPDLVPEDACAGKKAAAAATTTIFECPDVSWRNRLEGIQQGPILPKHAAAGLESQFRVSQRGGEVARLLPVVQTETEEGEEGLEGVVGVRDFVAKLPLIKRPRDMRAILDDPLLQHYMATGPDDIGELDAEVDEVLAGLFERELLALGGRGEEDHQQQKKKKKQQAISPKAVRTLHKVLQLARFQKFLPGSVERFVMAVVVRHEEASLPHLDLLLELLSWRYPDSHAWRDSILPEETERHIISLCGGELEPLLEHYTAVLRNRTATLLSGTSAFDGSPPDSPTAFTDHCSFMALTLVARSQSARTRGAVLPYLGMLAKLSSHATPDNAIPIFNLEGPMVYLMLFGRSTTVDGLSSLLSLLADYKKIFEEFVATSVGRGGAAAAASSSSSSSKYPPDFIRRLNGFLMDCCNLFWRSRAFYAKSDDKYAAGCLVHSATQDALAQYLQSAHPEYSLSTAFSLACHPALAGLASAAWDEMEAARLGISQDELAAKRRGFQQEEEEERRSDAMETEEKEKNDGSGVDSIQAVHFGPVSRLSLSRLEAVGGASVSWSHYRLAVLDWLDVHGSDGIGKLMKKTMKLLMDKPGSGLSTPVAASPAIPITVDTPMAG